MERSRRTARLTLESRAARAALLPEILGEARYTRVNGYIRITAAKSISALILYGDAAGRFLTVVPGIPR